MPEALFTDDHVERSRRAADLIRRWCRDQLLSETQERELAGALLRFVLESPVCRRRLRGLGRELGSQIDDEGQFILGLIMARNPRNRLGIILGDILDADDATLLAECRRRVRSAAINDAFHQLQSTDPNGHKILKGLGDALREHPDLFVLLPDGGAPTHVTVVRDGMLRTGSPEVGVDDVLRLLPEVCFQHKYMPGRLKALLTIIAEEDHWCAVVPIATLFEAFRQAAETEILSEAEDHLAHVEPSPLLRLAIDRAGCKARVAYRDRLAKNISDGHFTVAEANAICGAIEAILEECVQTGRWPREMKDNLKLQIPDLTDAHHERRFKARFQYLVGLVETTFFSALAREYGD